MARSFDERSAIAVLAMVVVAAIGLLVALLRNSPSDASGTRATPTPPERPVAADPAEAGGDGRTSGEPTSLTDGETAVVYLARELSPADTLPETVQPVLRAPECGVLPSAVATELSRLRPETVYSLAGSHAVGRGVVEQALGRQGSSICPDARIALTVSPASEPHAVAIRVHNGSLAVILLGRGYELERESGEGAYMPLDPPLGPFRGDAVPLDPGQTSEPNVVGPSVVQDGVLQPLLAGSYRYSTVIEGAYYDTIFAV